VAGQSGESACSYGYLDVIHSGNGPYAWHTMSCVAFHYKLTFNQGRSQKFVLGGIKFYGGIKLLNSRSDVIFTP